MKEYDTGRRFDGGVVFSVKYVRCGCSDFAARFWIISLHNGPNAIMDNLIQI